MKNENLYLIDEQQMERIEEIISELQSIYLDIYSNRSISLRGETSQPIGSFFSPTILGVFPSSTLK